MPLSYKTLTKKKLLSYRTFNPKKEKRKKEKKRDKVFIQPRLHEFLCKPLCNG